jgi:hypothetical protein
MRFKRGGAFKTRRSSRTVRICSFIISCTASVQCVGTKSRPFSRVLHWVCSSNAACTHAEIHAQKMGRPFFAEMCKTDSAEIWRQSKIAAMRTLRSAIQPISDFQELHCCYGTHSTSWCRRLIQGAFPCLTHHLPTVDPLQTSYPWLGSREGGCCPPRKSCHLVGKRTTSVFQPNKDNPLEVGTLQGTRLLPKRQGIDGCWTH